MGDAVLVQNQHGNKPKSWELSGTIVEVLDNDSYSVKIDGSGRVSKRRRQFIKKLKLFDPDELPEEVTVDPNEVAEEVTVDKVSPRRSDRIRAKHVAGGEISEFLVDKNLGEVIGLGTVLHSRDSNAEICREESETTAPHPYYIKGLLGL